MIATGFGSTLSFAGMKVIPCYWMTEQVFDYPQDPFIEYGPEDIWWLTKCEGRKWKTVPKSEAIVVGDKILMHPGFIDKFIASLAAVEKHQNQVVEKAYANAATTTTMDFNLDSLLELTKTFKPKKPSWLDDAFMGRYWR